jgi:hypothetical protein
MRRTGLAPHPTTGLPEPVEGHSFPSSWRKEEEHFDKLREAGLGWGAGAPASSV